jgi:hypothetical protein
MSEQEAQAQSVVREALRAGWGEAERRWPGINLAYEARRQSFVEGVAWERARHDTEDVLAMLDYLNESGGISYDDYDRLHDAVAALGGGDHE